MNEPTAEQSAQLQQEPMPPVKAKLPTKKLLIAVVTLVLLTVLAVVAVLAKGLITGQPKKEPPIEETKIEPLIKADKILSYRIQLPKTDVITSFIYYGEPSLSLFTPLNVYTLDKNFKLSVTPFSIAAQNKDGRPWCLGNGLSKFTISKDQKASYCLEMFNNSEIAVRKLDLKSNEYKEFYFKQDGELLSDARTSRVISSRDGDSAFIYSPVGAFAFESQKGELYYVDFPPNLEITNVVALSNTETAIVTDSNKIFRINFSNHKGGVFDVNFIGIGNEDLKKGLATLRLSKDSRRLVFTISDQIENLPAMGNEPSYQAVVAYNIDLNTSKVSDELNYEEKLLVSCKNPIGDKYCLYGMLQVGEEKNKTQEALYIKEHNNPLETVVTIYNNDKVNKKIRFEASDENSDYFFVQTPSVKDPKSQLETYPRIQVYSAKEKKLIPLDY
ncbi:hypothetical protein HY419_01620 [candidate division WWE3 bacterium]|nr:hypothetical protein [candidate division WWE3 bacterium]